MPWRRPTDPPCPPSTGPGPPGTVASVGTGFQAEPDPRADRRAVVPAMSRTPRNVTAAAAVFAVFGCVPDAGGPPTGSTTTTTSASTTSTTIVGPSTTTTSTTTTTTSTTTTTAPTPSGPGEAPRPTVTGSVLPTGSLTELKAGIGGAPWDLLRLDTGSTLVSLRDRGVVAELTAGGTLRDMATLPGPTGGGSGVLGLAVLKGTGGAPSHLYAFHTGASDNRISRAPITGSPGSYGLGTIQPVFTGLPQGSYHGGGRIGFGPDGMLYVAAGDAFVSSNAQNLSSNAGKILRMTPTGGVPADNPFAGSYVWSLGHRNVEGIGWGADGRMWASEFGEDATDELNLIQRGGNYGWPLREGTTGATNPSFIDPVATWTVAEASPAGITVVGNTVFVAALRGRRLLAVDVSVTPATKTAHFVNTVGRIRDVTPGPGTTLWVLTSNSDGFGTPQAGDERLLSVPIG